VDEIASSNAVPEREARISTTEMSFKKPFYAVTAILGVGLVGLASLFIYRAKKGNNL